MSVKQYKITLQPLDWYFFGGENTFGEGESANYYAKSNLFPQQSALLGMLRYELLRQNGLLPVVPTNQKDVDELIGKLSFSFSSSSSFNFGKIVSISPLFLSKNNELLYCEPMSKEWKTNFEKGKPVYFGTQSGILPEIKEFKGKEYYSQSLCWSTINGKRFSESQIFKTKTKIGITKTSDTENKDKAFFKTEVCKLEEGFSFVFYANLDVVNFKSSVVYLGAERSMFAMQVDEDSSNTAGLAKELTDNPLSAFAELDNLKKTIKVENNEIVFLSDAFVPEEVLNLCVFAWSDSKPFRNIIRNSTTRNYAKLCRSTERSGRFNLITRGSILYFEKDNKNKILTKLKNDYLQRSGYNFYIINETNNK